MRVALSTAAVAGLRWRPSDQVSVGYPGLSRSQRHRDVARRVTRLDTHQDRLLSGGSRLLDRIADLERIVHGLSGDIEDDVTRMDAALCCWPVRINLGHHHPPRAFARDCGGRRRSQAQRSAAVVVL